MGELSVREAAERLNVHQTRVRELLASGRLVGRHLGSRWVVDEDSVVRRLETAAGATGRPLSTRGAWSAAALLDGQTTPWLKTSERSRLRARLRRRQDTDTQTFRWWLQSRGSVRRYRLAESDLVELSSTDGVVSGGVGAASHYGLRLGHGGEAEIYVDSSAATRIVDEFFLIESTHGNLRLHAVAGNVHWHRITAQPVDGVLVAPRLIVAVDLLDSDDTRSRSAGARLLGQALDTISTGGRRG